MPADHPDDLFPPPTEADLRRVREALKPIGGPNTHFAPKDLIEVLLVERRMRADRLAADRLRRATWVLTWATIVLALATVGLIFATLHH